MKWIRSSRRGMIAAGPWWGAMALAMLAMLTPAAPVCAQAGDRAGPPSPPTPPSAAPSQPRAASEIVVTGTALAQPPATAAYDTVTLDRRALTTSASNRIEDVLGDVAGFQQFRRSDSTSANPSAQGATLRALGGNAASRSLVLLDGVPMADPMFGSVPFSAIAPDRLRAVEVTRGGGSGAFGAGAVAGTIALESAGPATLGLLSGEAMADDRGETELSGTLAPHLGDGFAVISGRWDRAEGFWTTPVGQRVPASVRAAYDSWSLATRGVMPVAPDIELQARGLVFDDRRTLRFAGANSQSDGADASLRLVGKGRWQFDALGYVQARGFSNVVISSASYRETLNQRSTPSTGIGGKLELRPPLGAAQVARFGIDWRTARGDLTEDPYSTVTGSITAHRHAGGRNGDVGLFAEDDWTLGSLTLTGGGRIDRWAIDDGYFYQTTPTGTLTTSDSYANRAGWAPSGRGGAVWKVAGPVSLRASIYSSIRQPTLNELYRSYVVSPVTIEANPALTGERLKGYEGGVDVTPAPGITLSATAFYNRLEHAIANVTIGTNLEIRENVSAIRARGVEFGASVKHGPIAVDGSLAWTDAVVEAPGSFAPGLASINGLRPAQTPKLSASATASWRPRLLDRQGWLLSATLRRVGAAFEDDQNNYVLPAATTLGAVAEAPLGRGFTLVLRGQNLTNATVETRNQAGSIDLDTPRTVWIGVKLGLH